MVFKLTPTKKIYMLKTVFLIDWIGIQKSILKIDYNKIKRAFLQQINYQNYSC